jgi:HdeA/HdeB family
MIKVIALGLLVFCAASGPSRAAEFNIATLTCVKYQNEILAAPVGNGGPDPINTVMWLFGYSVAKAGAHVMYGDALAGFGFGLDAECKNNPNESLLNAISTVKPDTKNPMDLNSVDCATFANRHYDMAKTDAESADTIMMWLFGFAVAQSSSHIYDSTGLKGFEDTLLADCRAHPDRSVFDELSGVKIPKPKA